LSVGVALCNIKRRNAPFVGHQVLNLPRAPNGKQAASPLMLRPERTQTPQRIVKAVAGQYRFEQ
jgi:hypothetical protein